MLDFQLQNVFFYRLYRNKKQNIYYTMLFLDKHAVENLQSVKHALFANKEEYNFFYDNKSHMQNTNTAFNYFLIAQNTNGEKLQILNLSKYLIPYNHIYRYLNEFINAHISYNCELGKFKINTIFLQKR